MSSPPGVFWAGVTPLVLERKTPVALSFRLQGLVPISLFTNRHQETMLEV